MAGGSAQAMLDSGTVYTHPTTAGNKHLPTAGATSNFLIYGERVEQHLGRLCQIRFTELVVEEHNIV